MAATLVSRDSWILNHRQRHSSHGELDDEEEGLVLEEGEEAVPPRGGESTPSRIYSKNEGNGRGSRKRPRPEALGPKPELRSKTTSEFPTQHYQRNSDHRKPFSTSDRSSGHPQHYSRKQESSSKSCASSGTKNMCSNRNSSLQYHNEADNNRYSNEKIVQAGIPRRSVHNQREPQQQQWGRRESFSPRVGESSKDQPEQPANTSDHFDCRSPSESRVSRAVGLPSSRFEPASRINIAKHQQQQHKQEDDRSFCDRNDRKLSQIDTKGSYHHGKHEGINKSANIARPQGKDSDYVRTENKDTYYRQGDSIDAHHSRQQERMSSRDKICHNGLSQPRTSSLVDSRYKNRHSSTENTQNSYGLQNSRASNSSLSHQRIHQDEYRYGAERSQNSYGRSQQEQPSLTHGQSVESNYYGRNTVEPRRQNEANQYAPSRDHTARSMESEYGRHQQRSSLNSNVSGDARRRNDSTREAQRLASHDGRTIHSGRPQHRATSDFRASVDTRRHGEGVQHQDEYDRYGKEAATPRETASYHGRSQHRSRMDSRSSHDSGKQRLQQHRSSLGSTPPHTGHAVNGVHRQTQGRHERGNDNQYQPASLTNVRNVPDSKPASVDLNPSSQIRQSDSQASPNGGDFVPTYSNHNDVRASVALDDLSSYNHATSSDSYQNNSYQPEQTRHICSNDSHGDAGKREAQQMGSEARRDPEYQRNSSPLKKRWRDEEGRRCFSKPQPPTVPNCETQSSLSKNLGMRWRPPQSPSQSKVNMANQQRTLEAMSLETKSIDASSESVISVSLIKEARESQQRQKLSMKGLAKEAGELQREKMSKGSVATKGSCQHPGSCVKPVTSSRTVEEKKRTADEKKGPHQTLKPELVPSIQRESLPKKSSLGIPTRWLKPASRPKKPGKPTSQGSSSLVPRLARTSEVESGRLSSSKSDEKGSNIRNSMRNSPKTDTKKQVQPPSPTANRLVTDSEGGSTVSNNKDLLAMVAEKKQEQRIPTAIVTKKAIAPRAEEFSFMESPIGSHGDNETVPEASFGSTTNNTRKTKTDENAQFEAASESSTASSSSESSGSSSSDESDTDDEEVMMWASKMFGVPFRAPLAHCKSQSSDGLGTKEEPDLKPRKLHLKLAPSRIQAVMFPIQKPRSEKVKTHKKKKNKKIKKHKYRPGVENGSGDEIGPAVKLPKNMRPYHRKKMDIWVTRLEAEEEIDEEKQRLEREEGKRIKEEAKPLTTAQIRAILGEDDFPASGSKTWVRRSVRQPSKALLNSKPVRALVSKLKHNDPAMQVLKMKKYVNDPNAPPVVLDAALDALEENSSCEALYIQNFNEGLRDRQVLHLLKILQQPACKIWCLNIGENYNVETDTWEKFTKGLRRTKVTHMYASEHTITTEMKDELRATIRENRKKHDMHSNPSNLDVIIQCTHCWWNPVNAKALRPFLKNRGYEHILQDREAQGLKGTTSEAPAK